MSDEAQGERRGRVEPSADRSREMTAEALRFKRSRLDPIRVFFRRGTWLVEYGSYARGRYSTRAEAVEKATKDARDEDRELVVGPPGEHPAVLPA